jgi:hypothetical protein
MVQTRAFEIKNSDKLQKFAEKFERPPPATDDAPQPKVKASIFDEMAIDENLDSDTGPTVTLDVVPDFRFILLTICFYVMRLYPTLEQKNRPLLTPSSLVSYCLFLTYGFMLTSDAYGRHTRSAFATRFLNEDDNKQLHEALLRAYIPPFMLEILHGLTPTVDPRRPGVEYIATFAGSLFTTDFGRIFPARIFLIAHHMSASTRSNMDPDDIIANWLDHEVLTFGTNQVKVANFFGAMITGHGTYVNYLYETVTSLFNPVTGRFLQSRPTFQRTETYTPNFSGYNEINPYELYLSSDAENSTIITKFIREMSVIVKSDLSATFQLGAVFSDLGGIQITTHGYSPMALPTWHYNSTDKSKQNKLTPTKFAQVVKFLQPQTFAATGKPKYPDDDKTITKVLYLVKKIASHDTATDPDTVITFNTRDHVAPRIRCLNPYVSSEQALSYTLITGLIIEHYSIDGTSVPMPNHLSSLQEENAQFLQSALPLKKVHRGSSQHGVLAINRSITEDKAQKVSFDLYDLAMNRLPYFDQESGDAVPTSLPGFEATEHVGYFARAFSKFGFKIGTLPNIADHSIPVWSPYRYVNARGRTLPTAENTFMLVNFRTLYGTSVPLIQVNHPSKAIPTA